MSSLDKISIGTRGSQLALVQANNVKSKLSVLHPQTKIEIVIIKTTGDRILDRNLNEIGGKGLFIKEIEEQLINNKIDIAVHSMKDLPAFLPDQLEISTVLEREDCKDALLSKNAKSIEEIPKNAIFGTSSPRRSAQILNIRPDLKIVPFRGNVQTRISKLLRNEVDATFLAMAGLNRLNISSDLIKSVDTKVCLPAVAQGAVGIEIRKDNVTIKKLLEPLNHANSHLCVSIERAFLACFEGSCHTPLAAYAQINNDNKIHFRCEIYKPDGSIKLQESFCSNIDDAIFNSIDCANKIKKIAGDNFFEV